MDDSLEYLAKKYDSEGTCHYDLYLLVSEDLRQEYELVHSLIRQYLEGPLYNYLPQNRNNSYEEDSD